jgi:hypothetical protein
LVLLLALAAGRAFCGGSGELSPTREGAAVIPPADNPFTGIWQAGDSTFSFKENGTFTTVSTHCCGLRFLDEYTYFIHDGTLLTYGAMMGGTPSIRKYRFAAGGEGAILVVTEGGTEWLYTRLPELPEEHSRLEEEYRLYVPPGEITNPFTGRWNVQASGVRSFDFRANGTVYTRNASGRGSEACYLVREDGIAFIDVSGKGFPGVTEYVFEIRGENVLMYEKGAETPWGVLGR